ncbi:hypothetical protein M758_12G157700 [Ceratodon purpureus]|uniref:Uncharacterized protein n=1 Tax=Ceratodon purpureus TaxID=3225 RepID=A0A8T0G7L5_CERPU|nr:hypothetical protein KC19_12G155200 [Ceratodon purpureus]KAG0599510.1 hypothetical protein M758_12G157700 [Ceratodon purpureus]
MANTLTLTDPYQYRPNKQRMRKGSSNGSSNSSSNPLTYCDELSSSAAIDIVILILVLGACGFLFTPYFTFIAAEAAEVVPAALVLIGEVVLQAPVAYASATVFTFVAVLASFEIYQYVNRKCDNPNCRGLRKAMELDIQLETEDCVKLSSGRELPWNGGVELGHEQKELEAELRRMAPPNGRAVLIFRNPCGCPAARFEASGSKKARRSKK